MRDDALNDPPVKQVTLVLQAFVCLPYFSGTVQSVLQLVAMRMIDFV